MKKSDRLLLQEIEDIINGDAECSKELLIRILASFKKNEHRHDKIMSQSDKQQMGLIKETEQQEKMLAQQAKMAAMGEMIDAIAHQWKQPLNAISMLSELAQMDFEENIVDATYMKEYKENVFTQIEHLITTLDEFRNFFRPNKSSSVFDVEKALRSVLLLVKDEFLKHSIDLSVQVQDAFTLDAIENEFKHVILNIINNAKDAFDENNVKNRKIKIMMFIEIDKKVITISDNAGGIPERIIKDIFKPNVTTKAEGKGTGIGLYMSDQITQKMGGKLAVKNEDEGAVFKFEV